MDLTLKELQARREKLFAAMEKRDGGWDTLIIASKVNQYYFTGTMHDALLIMRRSGEIYYFVRRSYERALQESPLSAENIFQMQSYGDAAKILGADLGNTYTELEIIPCAMMQRMEKHFKFARLMPADNIIRNVRAVKSPYELYWLEKAGAQHHELLVETVPTLLREGMSEAEFFGALMENMIKRGYQGITRFFKFQTEIIGGQVAFGENSLVPTCFDGPGGMKGACAAAPVTGCGERRLKKGDLVFVDLGFGMQGYHSDKTQLYIFGGEPSAELERAHLGCLEIERSVAAKLAPGAVPAVIYREMLAGLSDFMRESFMGFEERTVRFLGHGTGLHVDELPVIAEGFDEPLKENMVIALEPKRGVKGIGMAGVEDTYVVTPGGGRCITGGGREIMIVAI